MDDRHTCVSLDPKVGAVGCARTNRFVDRRSNRTLAVVLRPLERRLVFIRCFDLRTRPDWRSAVKLRFSYKNIHKPQAVLIHGHKYTHTHCANMVTRYIYQHARDMIDIRCGVKLIRSNCSRVRKVSRFFFCGFVSAFISLTKKHTSLVGVLVVAAKWSNKCERVA